MMTTPYAVCLKITQQIRNHRSRSLNECNSDYMFASQGFRSCPPQNRWLAKMLRLVKRLGKSSRLDNCCLLSVIQVVHRHFKFPVCLNELCWSVALKAFIRMMCLWWTGFPSPFICSQAFCVVKSGLQFTSCEN